MNVRRGEVWLANLNPTIGSEQSGTRPVLIFQNDELNKFTSTLLAIPITGNLRRAALPSSVRMRSGDGGLDKDSVLLCHQLRVLAKERLHARLGRVRPETLIEVEDCVLFTMGIQ